MKKIKLVFNIVLLIFGFCAPLGAMDANVFKFMTIKSSLKEIPAKNKQLSELKKEGVQLGLIIGRGNMEPGHSPLPGEVEGEITWVYTDCDRNKFNTIAGKPYIWMDFDSVDQVKMLESSLFKKIFFDWSVLKFFANLDKVIVELKRLLDDGGELLIPAGEQNGMVSMLDCEIYIEDKKYPINAAQCLKNRDEVFSLIAEKQKSYLIEIFGEENVHLVIGQSYPPAPEKLDSRNYFIVKK